MRNVLGERMTTTEAEFAFIERCFVFTMICLISAPVIAARESSTLRIDGFSDAHGRPFDSPSLADSRTPRAAVSRPRK